MAGVVSRVNVIGRTRANATVKVKPGIAPKTSPMRVPIRTARTASGARAAESAVKKASIRLVLQNSEIQVPGGKYAPRILPKRSQHPNASPTAMPMIVNGFLIFRIRPTITATVAKVARTNPTFSIRNP